MKTIKITDDCLLDGTHTKAGTVLKNVSESLAAQLLSSGRAELIKEKPEPIAVNAPASASPPKDDPKPAKKGKAKDDEPPAES
jgi:hypothetical protein